MAEQQQQNAARMLLEEENYNDWLIDVRALLRSKKLWQYATTPLPVRPEAPGENADVATKQQHIQSIQEHEELVEKHTEAADLVTPLISGAVKRKLILSDFDDINQMMGHLQELYNPRSEQVFMQLIQQLFTLQPDNLTIDEYLQQVKTLTERIDATNIELTSDRRTLLILSMQLGKRIQFKSMVQIWSVTKDMTAKRAIEMVREEERKLLLEHEEDTKALNRNNGALYTHKADGRPGQAKKWCTKCKKVSHDTANC
jgi:hypothetical protein